MEKGIWKIGQARLCPVCQADMAPEYVMRCLGAMKKDTCDRCGKEKQVTMLYWYTMNRRGLERIGRLEG